MCLLCRLQHDSPNAQATLNVQSAGHVLRAFVNGNFVGKPFFFCVFFPPNLTCFYYFTKAFSMAVFGYIMYAFAILRIRTWRSQQSKVLTR